jgi:hypothetical protein
MASCRGLAADLPQVLLKFNAANETAIWRIHPSFTRKAGTSPLRYLLMLSTRTQETKMTVVECLRSQRTRGRYAMFNKTKTLTALAAAATLGLAAVAAPQPAQAGGHGGAVAAGIIGGLAAGAIIGSAAHGPYYGYGYGPGYYGAAPAYYGGGCYWTRQRVWDGWGWRFRRVRVCD